MSDPRNVHGYRDFQIGDHVKVWLPGETPWAVVHWILPNGRWVGDIDNHLVNTEQHGISYGDRIVFRLETHEHCTLWVPEQRKFDRRRGDRRRISGGTRKWPPTPASSTPL